MVSLNLTADAEIKFFGLFSRNFDSSRENYPFMVSQKGGEAADTDLISRFFWPRISYRLIKYTYNEKSKSSNNPSVVRLDTETKMSMVLGHLCATHIMTLYFLKWLNLILLYPVPPYQGF